jgi:lysophospholipase L1-like esterase
LNYTQKSGRNGRLYFQPCLETHNPLDLVVIMLGTNDVKIEFGPRPAVGVAEALKKYIADVQTYAHDQNSRPPRIALVSPVHIASDAPMFAEYYTAKYDQRSVDAAAQLAPEIQKLADKSDCFFFDAAQVAGPGEDGIHMSLESHKALGDALAVKIMEWLA